MNKKSQPHSKPSSREAPIQRPKRAFGTAQSNNIPSKMVSEKPVIKPRTGAARSQSKPREIEEKPKISNTQLKSKTDEQVKEEETQKNVCFEESEKAKEVRNVGETEKEERIDAEHTPLLVINSKIPGTPYHSAENCSNCRLNRLESSSYWLAQIKRRVGKQAFCFGDILSPLPRMHC
ncbi:hypothetical protein Sjap_001578 [Stephania japonica]|uniref:Uncharacterized protein n=1 Tax=Stephania japonica TaxID=461633 RepID=A0AAP0KLR0_9MAGN